MIEIAIGLALVTFGEQDSVVVAVQEPRRPDVVSTDVDVRCGRRRLSLRGVTGHGAGFESPSLEFNGRPVDLSPDIRQFLVVERAAYRISAACLNSPSAVQLRIYRAEAAPDGSVSYVVRGLNVSATGRITDRGVEAADAETFWFH